MNRPTYIVEDDADVRAALVFMLNAGGRAAVAFADGPDLLTRATSLAPGTLLIDMRMPGQDGLDLLVQLRARGISWPAILMTGHGALPLAARAMALGAIDFLEKPFPEELLLTALAEAERLLEPLAAE